MIPSVIVEHSLNVEPGGSVTGSDGDLYIRICPDATVSGLELYAETPDNEVSAKFLNPNPEEYEFRYDSNAAKWIYPFDLFHKDMTSLYYLDSDIYLNLKKDTRSKLKDKYVYIASAIRKGQDSLAGIAEDPELPDWKIVDFGVIHGKKACLRIWGARSFI